MATKKTEASKALGVTLEAARKIIRAGEEKATAIGQPMNIAVVDAGANGDKSTSARRRSHEPLHGSPSLLDFATFASQSATPSMNSCSTSSDFFGLDTSKM